MKTVAELLEASEVARITAAEKKMNLFASSVVKKLIEDNLRRSQDKILESIRLHGLPIYTHNIFDHVQRRTHRKRRINKKWRKRYGFKKVPRDIIFAMDFGAHT